MLIWHDCEVIPTYILIYTYKYKYDYNFLVVLRYKHKQTTKKNISTICTASTEEFDSILLKINEKRN